MNAASRLLYCIKLYYCNETCSFHRIADFSSILSESSDRKPIFARMSRHATAVYNTGRKHTYWQRCGVEGWNLHTLFWYLINIHFRKYTDLGIKIKNLIVICKYFVIVSNCSKILIKFIAYILLRQSRKRHAMKNFWDSLLEDNISPIRKVPWFYASHLKPDSANVYWHVSRLMSEVIG